MTPLKKNDTFQIGDVVRRIVRGSTTENGLVSYEQLAPEMKAGRCRAIAFWKWAQQGAEPLNHQPKLREKKRKRR